MVTTAVQFFETLASNQPSALRKLHQLPGSAIFIDEAHAALPAHLWPVAWKWLRQLADDWSCHVVLGSGSLNRIWTLEEFVKPKVELPPLVKPEVRATSVAVERERIVPRTSPEPVGLDELTSWLPELPGPRLLILNTVQSAAAIARRLAEKFGRKNVEHLSTALAPIHRERSLQRIERRLARKRDRDWTLVATSCVEAGVDFSFRTGLRERCSLVSFIQTGGRVNRNGEYGESELWDFQLRPDVFLRPHPAFEDSAFVFGKMFAEGRVTPEFCTDALKRVLEIEGPKKAADELLKADAIGNFPFVAKEFRVIAQDTVTVVVSQKLVRRIETVRGYRPTPNELQDASVQIWSNKVAAWKPRPIQRMPELFAWTLRYDKFLGIMLGALELIEGGETGFIV